MSAAKRNGKVDTGRPLTAINDNPILPFLKNQLQAWRTVDVPPHLRYRDDSKHARGEARSKNDVTAGFVRGWSPALLNCLALGRDCRSCPVPTLGTQVEGFPHPVAQKQCHMPYAVQLCVDNEAPITPHMAHKFLETYGELCQGMY